MFAPHTERGSCIAGRVRVRVRIWLGLGLGLVAVQCISGTEDSIGEPARVKD